MRLPVRVAGALLLAAACSTPADPPPATTAPVPDGPIRGVLPDGTVYDVILEPIAHQSVTSVSAGVTEDGEVTEVTFRRTDGGWATEPALPVTTHLGLPMVELPPGLAWASDDQVPMEVNYRTFAVRRGCGPEAAACNPTQAVQAIPGDGWGAEEATVVSYALRRPTHPAYIDPGPLGGQNGHDLLWTGREMIVWGGSAPPRVAGAAYDPAEGQWRTLAAAPLAEAQPTRAVWAGDRMIVVAEEATVAYDPAADAWTRLGDGIFPPADPDRIAWTGRQVVAWTDQGVAALEETGWRDMADPGLAGGVLLVSDGRLLAVGPEDCDQRRLLELTPGGWQELTALPEGACPAVSQTAVLGGRVVTWRDRRHPTLIYDLENDGWEEEEPVPLEGIDRPSGALPLDGRLLVPRGADGAIFDPASGGWESVDLPGHGTDDTMLWTGQSVLMWSRCCYQPDDVDAWRWTPPP